MTTEKIVFIKGKRAKVDVPNSMLVEKKITPIEIGTEKETAFIRGGLTFWKCFICNGWHEGYRYKCPLKAEREETEKKVEWIKKQINKQSTTRREAYKTLMKLRQLCYLIS